MTHAEQETEVRSGIELHRALLRRRQLRVTGPRLAVLAALDVQGSHLNAEALTRAVRSKLGSISVQTVYDTLHTLEANGLVRKIQPAGQPARFEARVGDNHHHLICRACGATRDVDCATATAACLIPTETYGYEVDEAEVIFWGLCPECVPHQS